MIFEVRIGIRLSFFMKWKEWAFRDHQSSGFNIGMLASSYVVGRRHLIAPLPTPTGEATTHISNTNATNGNPHRSTYSDPAASNTRQLVVLLSYWHWHTMCSTYHFTMENVKIKISPAKKIVKWRLFYLFGFVICSVRNTWKSRATDVTKNFQKGWKKSRVSIL